MEITIRSIDISELEKVTRVLNQIPEFDSIFYTVQLKRKLGKSSSIILIAECNGDPIGCKVAYNRFFDGSIYSWLGGVLPEYRKQGVAGLLQNEMEAEARKKLYFSICMKTRNKHVNMLRFALKNGFLITGFQSKTDNFESRIELKKQL